MGAAAAAGAEAMLAVAPKSVTYFLQRFRQSNYIPKNGVL